jgi:hypothetical protein
MEIINAQDDWNRQNAFIDAHAAPPAPADVAGPLDAARKQLLAMSVGGCTCGIKSPDVHFHDARCHYRQAQECLENVEQAAAALTAQAGEIERLTRALDSVKRQREAAEHDANESVMMAGLRAEAADARAAELTTALRSSREYIVDTEGANDLPIVEAIDAALAKGGEP